MLYLFYDIETERKRRRAIAPIPRIVSSVKFPQVQRNLLFINVVEFMQKQNIETLIFGNMLAHVCPIKSDATPLARLGI